jgi:hypothetical protein
MFTGALAASYYGTPRTTMDIDIIISLRHSNQGKLANALREALLQVDEQKLRDAQETGYNIATLQDTLSPYTVDLILTAEPLEKKPCTILGQPTYIQTPESLISAKLRMIKATRDPARSAKDKNDIQSILKYTRVDAEKVRERAEKETTLYILQTILQ